MTEPIDANEPLVDEFKTPISHSPLPAQVAAPVGHFGVPAIAPRGVTLTFGDALLHLATTPGATIRRLAWAPDSSVLLIAEDQVLTLRKPAGTVHHALITREDIINNDWVVG